MKPKSTVPGSNERSVPAKALEGSADQGAFSRVIDIERVAGEGSDFTIEANADERKALAAVDGLIEIGKLEAHFHVAPVPGGLFHVSGHVSASITQTCVVSLETFESLVAEDVDVDFAAAEDSTKPDPMKLKPVKAKSSRSKPENALSYDHGKLEEDEEDPPDPIIDGKIDIGALASEFLALALDPYPRKPGVQFEEAATGDMDKPASPFAILRKLDKSP